MSSTKTPATTRTSTTMTIDQLKLSAFNVRTNEQDQNATDGMERSLLKYGLLLPLVVHPMKGSKTFGVLAGGRRYRSFQRLIERGDLPKTYEIDVIVRDLAEAELVELSLAENLIRRNLRDYEVYAAVARANRKGETPRQIADALGQELTWVTQCLRLGNLAPPIWDALEREAIGANQAKAFGATGAHVLQIAAWHKLKGRVNADGKLLSTPGEIHAAMKVGDQEAAKLLRFVGADAYRAANGRLEFDLFTEGGEERGRVVDEDMLRELVDQRLCTTRDALRTRVGRDIRFAAGPPLNQYNGTDYQLEIAPKSGTGDAIVLPEGDVIGVLTVTDAAEPEVKWWWESRKAKHGATRTAPAKPSHEKIDRAEGAALGLAPSYGARAEADALIRDETGLTIEGGGAIRALYRGILRAALINDARDGGEAGRDYLVWSQLRLAFGQDYRIRVGCRGIDTGHVDNDKGRELIRESEAGRAWDFAVRDIQTAAYITDADIPAAFVAFRACSAEHRNLAAAVVAGLSLEPSMNAGGYALGIHAQLAAEAGVDSDARVRRLWRPTDAFLRLLPRAQQQKLVEPFVENATFGTWTRLKADQLLPLILAVVTGTSQAVRRSMREAAASWVHPLLRFNAAAPPDEHADEDEDEKTLELSEAAE